jgi:hypothetical protein
MENVNNNGWGKCVIYTVTILATFLLMFFLVREMVRITRPAPLGVERAVARATDNAKIRADGEQASKSWGYVDAPRGIVRMPLDEAMKLTVQGYQKPDEFRKDVLARSEKASAPPPKVVNPYE